MDIHLTEIESKPKRWRNLCKRKKLSREVSWRHSSSLVNFCSNVFGITSWTQCKKALKYPFFLKSKKNFANSKKIFVKLPPPLPPILADGVENFSFVMLLKNSHCKRESKNLISNYLIYWYPRNNFFFIVFILKSRKTCILH